MKIITKKEILKIFLFSLLLIALLYFSKINFITTKNTIETFLTITMPSLFPFIIFSQIIINSDIIEILNNKLKILSKIFKVSKNSSFIIFLSYIVGFPSSANIINKLYKEKRITYDDALILSSFTNNASPIFIISTIGIAMFNNINIGIILLISHFVSSILIGIIFSRIHTYIIHYKSQNLNTLTKINTKKNNILISNSELLEKSINSSFKICLNMLGFMIIFNILSELFINIFNIKNNLLKDILIGIFEIINGCKNIKNLNLYNSLIVISFIISFSGLCIIFQIKSQFKDINISLKKILIFKLIHGITSSILTYILLNTLSPSIINVYANVETMLNNNISLNNLYTYYLNTLSLAILTVSTILIIYYNKKRYIKINKLYKK